VCPSQHRDVAEEMTDAAQRVLLLARHPLERDCRILMRINSMMSSRVTRIGRSRTVMLENLADPAMPSIQVFATPAHEWVGRCGSLLGSNAKTGTNVRSEADIKRRSVGSAKYAETA
jgi:hypothetical protein